MLRKYHWLHLLSSKENIIDGIYLSRNENIIDGTFCDEKKISSMASTRFVDGCFTRHCASLHRHSPRTLFPEEYPRDENIYILAPSMKNIREKKK